MADIDRVLFLVAAKSAKQAAEWAQSHNLTDYYCYLYSQESLHGRYDCYVVRLPGFYQHAHYTKIDQWLKDYSKANRLTLVSYLNPTMI